MIEKEWQYQVKRKVKGEVFHESFYAFQDETYIDEKLVRVEEGITYYENLVKARGKGEISVLEKYALYDKKVIELLRTCQADEVYDRIEKERMQIDKPYSYIQKNGAENVVLLHLNMALDGRAYDINGKRLPKVYPFDYIKGEIDNKAFDLEQVLKILTERKDVKVISNGIIKIPSYNAERNRDKTIEFHWIPSEEDFQKMPLFDVSFEEREWIIDEVLKLPRSHK